MLRHTCIQKTLASFFVMVVMRIENRPDLFLPEKSNVEILLQPTHGRFDTQDVIKSKLPNQPEVVVVKEVFFVSFVRRRFHTNLQSSFNFVSTSSCNNNGGIREASRDYGGHHGES